MAKTQVFISGHGGQGVLDLGNFIAYDNMLKDRRVVYTPSYGPESRGGKVKCFVVFAEGEIDSPIAEEPDILLVMNLPSMDFEVELKPNGLFFYNTSLVDKEPVRADTFRIPVPATEISTKLEERLDADYLKGIRDTKMAQNFVMYGAYLEYTQTSIDFLEKTFYHFYEGKKEKFIPLNNAAVEANMDKVSKPE